MLRKAFIIGLVFLFAGSAGLGLLSISRRKEQQQAAFFRTKHDSQAAEYLREYNEWLKTPAEERTLLPKGLDKSTRPVSAAKLWQEQHERLQADLEQLAAGEKNVYPFADFMYGKDWRKTLSNYQKRKEMQEITFVSAVFCTAAGGAFISWCLLLLASRLIIRTFRAFAQYIRSFYIALMQRKYMELDEFDIEQIENDSGLKKKIEKKRSHLNKMRAQTLSNSGWHQYEANSASQSSLSCCSNAYAEDGENCENSSAEIKTIAVKLCEEESLEPEEAVSSTAEPDETKDNLQQSEDLEESGGKCIPDSTGDRAEAEAEDFQEQEDESGQAVGVPCQSFPDSDENVSSLSDVFEAEQSTQAVQQAVLENSEPVSDTLKQLTSHISAIREYASFQQDKVKKLQAGYDWRIIRTFCLRIIRCIDNLEDRIAQLSEEGLDTVYLKEVRDELIFSLESGGVEQFKPALNSEYRGQEKTTEVVKERETANESELSGKIARVIRPGYRYVIDEEDTKVVRTAQVKLFG